MQDWTRQVDAYLVVPYVGLCYLHTPQLTENTRGSFEKSCYCVVSIRVRPLLRNSYAGSCVQQRRIDVIAFLKQSRVRSCSLEIRRM
ncbi:hypothetical protein HBI56_086580 [Parastagonospora nodorum]|uniref:Uncharacterized protein n=1 Tax=Phaeosphaeria nodorum (strain SN15 / ATCC MYA-4574 / FGSC 10173) TaxID=321614 RepID=A0A7U2I4Y1_PHANO|nr:hypothetical protein HBH56_113010 [Parastagonospora nodorum]QRD03546.1 hypothetical protein JI435_419760 [Parastagonospora nodorum SN15]KAH3921529.1 hypothetical protein HBH54_239460 [Parastagonospora nodorum]KAH3951059.1 hypothetical protein HBH53_068670 [Parastagonospora nodorum]KAH3962976.1 hypothetical protein HBH51_169340 [Parastagonospora nodorum]